MGLQSCEVLWASIQRRFGEAVRFEGEPMDALLKRASASTALAGLAAVHQRGCVLPRCCFRSHARRRPPLLRTALSCSALQRTCGRRSCQPLCRSAGSWPNVSRWCAEKEAEGVTRVELRNANTGAGAAPPPAARAATRAASGRAVNASKTNLKGAAAKAHAAKVEKQLVKGSASKKRARPGKKVCPIGRTCKLRSSLAASARDRSAAYTTLMVKRAHAGQERRECRQQRRN